MNWNRIACFSIKVLRFQLNSWNQAFPSKCTFPKLQLVSCYPAIPQSFRAALVPGLKFFSRYLRNPSLIYNNVHQKRLTTHLPISRSKKQQQNNEGSSGSGSQSYLRKWYPTMPLMGFFGFLFGQNDDAELSVEDKILMTIKRAILAIQRQEYPKAQHLLKKAYAMSEVESLEDAMTQILDIEANLCMQLAEFEKAESLFKKVAQRLVNSGRVPPTDNSIVEISIKLSEIYKLLGRLGDAEAGFQYCLEAQRDKIKNSETDEDTLLLAAWAGHGLSQLRLAKAGTQKDSIEQIENSVKLIQEAHDYAVKASGADAQQAVAILADLATAQAMLGKFDDALLTVQNCAELSKDKHPDLLVTIQLNAGNLLLQKGDFANAENVCAEAARFADKIQDPGLKARAIECLRAAGASLKGTASASS